MPNPKIIPGYIAHQGCDLVPAILGGYDDKINLLSGEPSVPPYYSRKPLFGAYMLYESNSDTGSSNQTKSITVPGYFLTMGHFLSATFYDRPVNADPLLCIYFKRTFIGFLKPNKDNLFYDEYPNVPTMNNFSFGKLTDYNVGANYYFTIAICLRSYPKDTTITDPWDDRAYYSNRPFPSDQVFTTQFLGIKTVLEDKAYTSVEMDAFDTEEIFNFTYKFPNVPTTWFGMQTHYSTDYPFEGQAYLALDYIPIPCQDGGIDLSGYFNIKTINDLYGFMVKTTPNFGDYYVVTKLQIRSCDSLIQF